MILFKCACGANCSAENEAAGTVVKCGRCQKDNSVPQKSEPELILLKKDEAHDPVVLSRAAVEQMMADGELDAAKGWNERSGDWTDLKEALAGKGKATRKKEKKKRSKYYHMTQGAIAVLAVIVGYWLGFGPLISSMRKLPTRVVVQNHENVQYQARLGWRRLKQELYPKSICSFELFVGMNEKQGLKLKPVEPPDAAPAKMKVPLRPGSVVLVNVNAVGKYAAYDPELVKNEALDAPKQINEQILKNIAPASAPAAVKKLAEIGKKALIEVTSLPFYFATDYNMAAIPMLHSEELQSNPDAPPRPRLTSDGKLLLSGKDWQLEHYYQDTEKEYAQIRLPGGELSLASGRFTLKCPAVMARLTGDAGKFNIDFSIPAKIESEKQTFSGTWAYHADNAKGEWNWRWVFRGNNADKVEPQKLDITLDKDGNVTSEKITSGRY